MKNSWQSNVVVLSLVGLGIFFLPLVEKKMFLGSLLTGILLMLLVFVVQKKNQVIVAILFCILLHAQWGIAQFVVQGDLNLRLLGETRLAVDEVSVAKFGDEKTLRAYGPYKHANSYAGVLVVGLSMMVAMRRKVKSVRVWNLLFGVMVLGILVSFSRAALVSLFILLLVDLYWQKKKEISLVCVGLVVIFMLVFTPFYIERLSDSKDMAVYERVSGYSWSLKIIEDNDLWRGVWPRSYKEVLKDKLDSSDIYYNEWQIDYVHSVPLLGLSLFGVAPMLVTLMVLVGLLYKCVPRNRLIIIISIVPLLFLDHYFVTQVSPFIYLVLLIFI